METNIPKSQNEEKPLVKRILIEVSTSEKGNEKVNFQANNLTPFEIIGLLSYYKERQEVSLFQQECKSATETK